MLLYRSRAIILSGVSPSLMSHGKKHPINYSVFHFPTLDSSNVLCWLCLDPFACCYKLSWDFMRPSVPYFFISVGWVAQHGVWGGGGRPPGQHFIFLLWGRQLLFTLCFGAGNIFHVDGAERPWVSKEVRLNLTFIVLYSRRNELNKKLRSCQWLLVTLPNLSLTGCL